LVTPKCHVTKKSLLFAFRLVIDHYDLFTMINHHQQTWIYRQLHDQQNHASHGSRTSSSGIPNCQSCNEDPSSRKVSFDPPPVVVSPVADRQVNQRKRKASVDRTENARDPLQHGKLQRLSESSRFPFPPSKEERSHGSAVEQQTGTSTQVGQPKDERAEQHDSDTSKGGTFALQVDQSNAGLLMLVEATTIAASKSSARARRFCQSPGCNKHPQRGTGLCISHGGECSSVLVSFARSSSHFDLLQMSTGGERCTSDGCNKSAIYGTNLCAKHGGGRRCCLEGCDKGARPPSYLKCINHGGKF
jgi:hypothetical protein